MCSKCHYVTLKTLNDCITSSITDKLYEKTWKEFCEIEVQSEIAYNNLKDR